MTHRLGPQRTDRAVLASTKDRERVVGEVPHGVEVADPVHVMVIDPIEVAGEPIRGPVERTLLVGRSVLPGLGQEGQLLAAWGAARLVTRTDRQKERMRRDRWSKVEIG